MVSGSERGLLEKGSFQQLHFLEMLDNLELLEILESPRVRKRKGSLPISRDSRDFRGSKASSSEKTPGLMDPFSGPEVTELAPV